MTIQPYEAIFARPELTGATMAWREISADGETWKVDTLFERSGEGSDAWRLVLSFRSSDGDPNTPTVWAPCPSLRGPRAALYVEADRIPDETLRALLSSHVNNIREAGPDARNARRKMRRTLRQPS